MFLISNSLYVFSTTGYAYIIFICMTIVKSLSRFNTDLQTFCFTPFRRHRCAQIHISENENQLSLRQKTNKRQFVPRDLT